ncbi:MAG: Mur ligase family protein [Ignavibacteriota bacterium]
MAVVAESPAPEDLAARWVEVDHGRQTLALASRNFYGKPDERLGLTGITGTNGKTTTAYLIDSVLRAAGKTTAMIGTIEYHVAGRSSCREHDARIA